ncbi:MAG: RNA degradosome polyphosphate kinase, partial [Leifsonia sp.]|nr:RNA degradosome polyphosphate kinase [Leifsonia sp.]
MDERTTLENGLLDTGLGGSLGSDFDDDFAPFIYEPDPTLPDNRCLDRELSWLAINQRVLELAEDPLLPVLERANFLAIFA